MKDIYTEYFVFMKEAKNVYISSVDENTKPEISYSPCVVAVSYTHLTLPTILLV